MTYREFFQTARGDDQLPFAYQCRLAGGDEADPAGQFDHGTPCRSQLISIPTGLGKTAAVVLAWLWNRVHLPAHNSQLVTDNSTQWPRRLVYCLPMRTLVEQTAKEVEKWLRNLRQAAVEGRLELSDEAFQDLLWLAGLDGLTDSQISNLPSAIRAAATKPHSPVILMGGEDPDREWDIYPERPAILIGTQDMLLSRALNRGYGMSRYRWPMHFGLLNSDCLWVVDETQLMGVGVETSAQLDGFRGDEKMPTVGTCATWWMSATLEDSRLATVDHPIPPNGWPRLELSAEERETPGSKPKALFEAKKTISQCELSLSPATKADYAKKLAALIAERHRALLEKPHDQATLTLVVVNRVGRAQEIFKALTTPEKKSKQPLWDPARVALIHSRFRRKDREKHEELLFGDGDRIVIATQAVEAGVDVSARLLITELAPWSSLVQRFGRCNRRAEFSDAEVLWVDIESDPKGDLLLPYTKSELDRARTAISGLTDASPRSLSGIKLAEAPIIRPIIRCRDLVDLFDTTPDICGQDLDISRYIRDGEDSDLQFFWRDVEGDSPSREEPPPRRHELCRVSIGEAAKFLGKKPRAWRWNPLDEQWEPVSYARPGSICLVAADAGGYSDALGWTGDPKDEPMPCPEPDGGLEYYAGDRLSLTREWQTIAAHTAQVVDELASIIATIEVSIDDIAALKAAALWHDIGKAHPEFQKMLRDGPHQPDDSSALFAKSKNPPRRSNAS
ncbi:MAG TPA: hypothetical protein DCE44_01875, partial [Verrucomicrobiales bacterium]|nr:hypothetical protein [Verrucomicrobiales bacterium]